MRRFAAALLSCALFSAVTLAVWLAAPASDVGAWQTGAQYAAGASSGEAVVAEARGWIGTPYVAGGTDCSGLTSAVYGQFGLFLPDSPAAQYGYGAPSGANAGDLVFFDEHGAGISHVGIATGDGTMIHASTYFGEVVESPIGSVPGYVGAADVY